MIVLIFAITLLIYMLNSCKVKEGNRQYADEEKGTDVIKNITLTCCGEEEVDSLPTLGPFVDGQSICDEALVLAKRRRGELSHLIDSCTYKNNSCQCKCSRQAEGKCKKVARIAFVFVIIILLAIIVFLIGLFFLIRWLLFSRT